MSGALRISNLTFWLFTFPFLPQICNYYFVSRTPGRLSTSTLWAVATSDLQLLGSVRGLQLRAAAVTGHQRPSVSSCHFSLLSEWMFFPRCMILCPVHRMLLDDYLSPKTPGMTCLNFHDKTVSNISDCRWEEPELVSRWLFDISTSNRKEGALGRRDAKQNFSMKMRGGCQWMEGREESGLTYRACNWPPVFNSLSLFEFFFVQPTEHSCKIEPRRLWHVHWPTMSDDIQDDPQALRRFRLLPQPHHCQGHHHPSITLFLFPSMSRSPCVRPLPFLSLPFGPWLNYSCLREAFWNRSPNEFLQSFTVAVSWYRKL